MDEKYYELESKIDALMKYILERDGLENTKDLIEEIKRIDDYAKSSHGLA